MLIVRLRHDFYYTPATLVYVLPIPATTFPHIRKFIYYIVESKILKIHSKIFSISSLVKISITPIILCFQNGDVCKSSEPIFTFVQRKNFMFMSKKNTRKLFTGILF